MELSSIAKKYLSCYKSLWDGKIRSWIRYKLEVVLRNTNSVFSVIQPICPCTKKLLLLFMIRLRGTSTDQNQILYTLTNFMPGLLLYSLETENQEFFYVFRGARKRPVA